MTLFIRKREAALPIEVVAEADGPTETEAAGGAPQDSARAQQAVELAWNAYHAALEAEAPEDEVERLSAVWNAAEEDLQRLLGLDDRELPAPLDVAAARTQLAALTKTIAHAAQEYHDAAAAYVAATARNSDALRKHEQMMIQQPLLETDAQIRRFEQMGNEASAAFAAYDSASDALERTRGAWQAADEVLTLSLMALDDEDIAARRTDALASFEPGSFSVVVSGFDDLVVPFSEETSAHIAAVYLAARLGLTKDEAATACKRVAHIGPETVLFDVSLDDAIRAKDELLRLGADATLSENATATAGSSSRQAIPERVRHEVWRRDQGRCVDCGSRERLEFDHVVPVSKGGANTARNIELRCEPCNRKKAARV